MAMSSLQLKKDATTITTAIQNATELFLPIDSSNTSLEEVEPSFSACFELKNPDSKSFNFMLEMRSSAAAPTIYEKVQELWTRTDRRDNAVPLEIFTARFDRYAFPNHFSRFTDIHSVELRGNFTSLPRTVSTLVASTLGWRNLPRASS